MSELLALSSDLLTFLLSSLFHALTWWPFPLCHVKVREHSHFSSDWVKLQKVCACLRGLGALTSCCWGSCSCLFSMLAADTSCVQLLKPGGWYGTADHHQGAHVWNRFTSSESRCEHQQVLNREKPAAQLLMM